MPASGVPAPSALVRRNFVLNVLDGAVFGFGMSLVARTTVLPLLVSRAGGSNIAIGLIPVLWILGRNLPQAVAAAWSDRASSLHRFVLITSLLQRLPWLLITVLVVYQDAVPPGLLTACVLLGIAVAAVASGFNMPAWFDLVARLTPIPLRGRLFGARAVLGGGLGIVSGWIVILVLDRYGWPDGFALLFAASFVAMMLSYVFLILLRDVREGMPRGGLPVRAAVARLPHLLKSSGNFVRFLAADVLLVMSTLSAAFLTVAVFERFEIADSEVGRFTMVSTGSAMAGAAVFGWLADRLGHRLNLVVSALASAGSCVIAVLAPSASVFYLAFALAAVSEGLRTLSQLPFVAELCRERDRPSFVALANLAVAPFVLIGIAAGALADALGYLAVFLPAGLAATGALILLLTVKEPRFLPSKIEADQ